jgi:hypothetical protein
MDISNFYLMTPLERPEYILIRLSDVPEEIIQAKGMIHMKVVRGMYGLPQAGLLANKLLKKRLKQTRAWTMEARHTSDTVCLTVDDFGVKYVGREHAEHLKMVLEQHCKVTVTCDWTGERYIGIHMHWDYAKKKVHLYMPGYVERALIGFNYDNDMSWAKNKTNCSHTH